MTDVLEKPVEARQRQKIRLSLDMTPEMKEVLDDLASRDGITVAELMRRSVALLKAAKDAQQRGEALALISEDGRVTARLIGF